jgi:hypothetical protein
LIPVPTPGFFPPFTTATAVDKRYLLPYTLQWNAAVEHSFGANQTVTASYVAAAGRRLLRQESRTNPNPNFNFFVLIRNGATSDYHSMQLQYQRRLSRGLQAVASYTWAHSIDTASTDASSFPPGDKIDINGERGPSDFDVRHSFSAAMTYDIPTGSIAGFAKTLLAHWSVDTIILARSATPVDVTFLRNLGFGNFRFRPDLVPGVPLYIEDPSAPGGLRINNAVIAGNSRQVGPFLVQTDQRQGTLGRNALRGFPITQVNFAVRRQFNLTERVGLQLRAEFFNVFNHPNFADPASSLGSVTAAGTFVSSGATFGRSARMLGQSLGSGGQSGGFSPLYQIGGPRSVQFAVRLSF